jgi:hypothetical protein
MAFACHLCVVTIAMRLSCGAKLAKDAKLLSRNDKWESAKNDRAVRKQRKKAE